jgi:hypothetical protein
MTQPLPLWLIAAFAPAAAPSAIAALTANVWHATGSVAMIQQLKPRLLPLVIYVFVADIFWFLFGWLQYSTLNLLISCLFFTFTLY